MPTSDPARLKELQEAMKEAEMESRPVPVPNLRALGLLPDASLESTGGAGRTLPTYRAVLEDICGVADDSQEVEQYDGTLGVSTAFVAARQSAVGQVQWNDNLASVFTNPGDVSGARWGSGTMISPDLFLTCAHLFDEVANGWSLPRDNGTGAIISPTQTALNMHVNFNFQEDPEGNPRTEQSFPITQLVEYRTNGIDFAVCRLGGNPGATFGITGVAIEDAAVNDMICIIGHPAGMRKRIEAGPATQLDGDAIRYNDIDTLGGNSGSGVLHANSQLLVGVHTNGGCNSAGTGSNSGVRITSILRESPSVRNIAHAGRWIARHGLDGARYQQAFDEAARNGYRLVHVNAAGVAGGVSYAAVWEHRPGPDWTARHGLTAQQYQAVFNELVPQGFRPTVVSGAGVGNQILYAALFEKGAAASWTARHGLSAQQYQATFDELVRRGHRPRFVNGATQGNQVFYAAVFEQGAPFAWAARHGLNAQQYQGAFDEFVGQGFRPSWVSTTAVGNEISYAAIFERRPGPNFVARHGLSSAQYQATFDDLLRQGFRPVVVSGAGVGREVFYAAIWEQR